MDKIPLNEVYTRARTMQQNDFNSWVAKQLFNEPPTVDCSDKLNNVYLMSNEAQPQPDDLAGVTKRNWFEKLPLHWRYICYMVGGIIIGLLLPYVW